MRCLVEEQRPDNGKRERQKWITNTFPCIIHTFSFLHIHAIFFIYFPSPYKKTSPYHIPCAMAAFRQTYLILGPLRCGVSSASSLPEKGLAPPGDAATPPPPFVKTFPTTPWSIRGGRTCGFVLIYQGQIGTLGGWANRTTAN